MFLWYRRFNFKIFLEPNRNSISHLSFSQNPLLVVSYLSSLGGRQINEKVQNFTMSYLVNSCGLSLEKAKLASRNRKLHFDTPERPDSVLNLLKNHGFTNAQISKVVSQRPRLLLADPEKSLLPKLEFFSSIGLSHSDCAQIFTSCTTLLHISIKNHLIPCYDLLKSVLVEDEKVIICLKRARRYLCHRVDKNLAPNLALLTEIGVPQSSICLLLKRCPTSVFMKHSKFDETVKEIKDMGFDPVKGVFIEAIRMLSVVSKANWEHKFDVYEKRGWSEDETLLAFKKQPQCMIISEKKIMKAMNFFVDKMGCPSEDITRNPAVLLLSLEKRIIPRCSVIRILIFKGLIKKEVSLASFSYISENCFLERYVTKFQQEVPKLLDVYQGKVDLLGIIGIAFEKMCGSKVKTF